MTAVDLSPPESKIGVLRSILLALLGEHERDGALPTSAGFLYYELVQRGELSKERTGARRPDQNLHDALTDIREDGRVPWDWIVDETRSLDDYTGHPTIRQGVLDSLPYIALDPWRGRVPMVLTESRSLAGVLRDVVSDYRACIASTNGQCGGFLRTGIAPKLEPRDRIIYLGDLDLAGNQIEANTRRVLEREIGGELLWERLAYSWGDIHYAHTDHVKWWRGEIKKRGSLEAVYRYIEKRLAAEGNPLFETLQDIRAERSTKG